MWLVSKINKPVHVPRKQHLIYWKWCWLSSRKDVECSPKVIVNMEIWSIEEIKRDTFYTVAVSILLYGCTTWILTKQREKARWKQWKNLLNTFWKQRLHKIEDVLPFTSNFTNNPCKMIKIYRKLLEKKGWAHKWRSLMDSYSWTYKYWSISNDNSSVRWLDGAKRVDQVRWIIGIDRLRERESESHGIPNQCDLMTMIMMMNILCPFAAFTFYVTISSLSIDNLQLLLFRAFSNFILTWILWHNLLPLWKEIQFLASVFLFLVMSRSALV